MIALFEKQLVSAVRSTAFALRRARGGDFRTASTARIEEGCRASMSIVRLCGR